MSVITAKEVTKEKLIEIFNNAALEVVADDDSNEICVKGTDFPLWVSIEEEGQFIRLRTYLECKEGAPLEELPSLAALCNDEYVLVNFTTTVYEDGRGYLNGIYYIYYNFGLIAPQLVYSTKKFSAIFLAALREFDSEDKFFS